MIYATTATIPNVLTTLGFEKLGRGVSYYASQKTDGNETLLEDPTLIILCAWAFAQPKHIGKYLQPYQEIYPKADILLIQNIIANAIWTPDSWQLDFFKPAADKVNRHIQSAQNRRILVHVFSNGGSHAAVQLSEACRLLHGGMKLPVDALVLDSAPAQPRIAPTIKALVQGIPSRNPLVRGVATGLSYFSIGATILADLLEIAEPAAWKLYRKLNDPYDSFLLQHKSAAEIPHRVVPRTYIFSKSDEMVLAEDVLGHARIAKEKLLAAGVSEDVVEANVLLEEFTGTGHVNHVKADSERYWRSVKRTWEKTHQP